MNRKSVGIAGVGEDDPGRLHVFADKVRGWTAEGKLSASGSWDMLEHTQALYRAFGFEGQI